MERLAGFAGITKDDVVLDVGCGDGRSLLHLASTVGCRGVGIDIDEELVGTARCAARAAVAQAQFEQGVVRFEVADMCTALERYLAGVSVILLYLIADALVLLHPHLRAALRSHGDAGRVRVVTQVYHYDFEAQRTRPLADDPNWKLRMFSGEAFESGNLASKMSEHVVTIST